MTYQILCGHLISEALFFYRFLSFQSSSEQATSQGRPATFQFQVGRQTSTSHKAGAQNAEIPREDAGACQ